MSLASDISCFRGEDVVIEVSIDEDITGVPLTFALWNESTLWNELSGEPILTKTIGSGITVTGATDGEAEVTLSSSETNRNSCYYTLSRSDSGQKALYAHGNLTIGRPKAI